MHLTPTSQHCYTTFSASLHQLHSPCAAAASKLWRHCHSSWLDTTICSFICNVFPRSFFQCNTLLSPVRLLRFNEWDTGLTMEPGRLASLTIHNLFWVTSTGSTILCLPTFHSLQRRVEGKKCPRNTFLVKNQFNLSCQRCPTAAFKLWRHYSSWCHQNKTHFFAPFTLTPHEPCHTHIHFLHHRIIKMLSISSDTLMSLSQA